MKTYTTKVVEVITTDAEGKVINHERTTTTNTPVDVQPQRQAVDEVFEEVDKVFEHVDNIFTKVSKLLKRIKG